MLANRFSIMQRGTLDIPAELRSRLSMEYSGVMLATSATAAAASSPSELEQQQHQRRYAVLDYEQVKRLDAVMDLVVPIHGRGNFPTLEVRLKDLVQVVRAKLERDSVVVRDIRLNGGAACHVLAASTVEPQPYNDLDLIFGVELSTPRCYDRVKTAVLESLLDFLPEGVSKKRISSCSLKEAYVHKMVKVTTEGDRWSLISLSNTRGRNVELKFVDTMRRQFEFSVDSFQILLDSLLVFYDCAAETPIGENFYPTVAGESVYGDFQESLYHLNKKLIATRNPEEIRGGGLLKYCNLLVRGYRPVRQDHIKALERYMCSRFFIDFSDLGQQQHKLEGYLMNHFVGEEHFIVPYLTRLHRVVDESTVCLMGHERRQTLGLIEDLACHYHFREQHQQHLLYGKSTNTQTPFDFPVIYGTSPAYYYTPYVTATTPYSCTTYSWMSCA